MLVLGIDTSTLIGSVGLIRNGDPVSEFTLNVDVTHSERLLSGIEFLLKSSNVGLGEIDLIAYSRGPGSFTGLRIGLATVKGIAFSTGQKIVGVSSLEILAMNARYSGWPVCTMIDARKSEVYAALYGFKDGGKARVLKKENAVSPAKFVKNLKGKVVFLGTGARLYEKVIQRNLRSAIIAPKEFDIPHGINLALLGLASYRKGRVDDLDSAVPRYLRKSEAEMGRRHKKPVKSARCR